MFLLITSVLATSSCVTAATSVLAEEILSDTFKKYLLFSFTSWVLFDMIPASEYTWFTFSLNISVLFLIV